MATSSQYIYKSGISIRHPRVQNLQLLLHNGKRLPLKYLITIQSYRLHFYLSALEEQKDSKRLSNHCHRRCLKRSATENQKNSVKTIRKAKLMYQHLLISFEIGTLFIHESREILPKQNFSILKMDKLGLKLDLASDRGQSNTICFLKIHQTVFYETYSATNVTLLTFESFCTFLPSKQSHFNDIILHLKKPFIHDQ